MNGTRRWYPEDVVRELMAREWQAGWIVGNRWAFSDADADAIESNPNAPAGGLGEWNERHAAPVRGRPLGAASGGDPGFWGRLGYDDGGLPEHLPMGVNERGQGPEPDAAAYTFVCWCLDPECPLTLALGHAWAAGRSLGHDDDHGPRSPGAAGS